MPQALQALQGLLVLKVRRVRLVRKESRELLAPLVHRGRLELMEPQAQLARRGQQARRVTRAILVLQGRKETPVLPARQDRREIQAQPAQQAHKARPETLAQPGRRGPRVLPAHRARKASPDRTVLLSCFATSGMTNRSIRPTWAALRSSSRLLFRAERARPRFRRLQCSDSIRSAGSCVRPRRRTEAIAI